MKEAQTKMCFYCCAEFYCFCLITILSFISIYLKGVFGRFWDTHILSSNQLISHTCCRSTTTQRLPQRLPLPKVQDSDFSRTWLWPDLVCSESSESGERVVIKVACWMMLDHLQQRSPWISAVFRRDSQRSRKMTHCFIDLVFWNQTGFLMFCEKEFCEFCCHGNKVIKTFAEESHSSLQ